MKYILESPSKKIYHKYTLEFKQNVKLNGDFFFFTYCKLFIYIVRQVFKGDNYSREETINY